MANTNKDEIYLQQARRRKPKNSCDSSSSSKREKQPRRGMGVEKLERLRLQERWKKITDTSIDASFSNNDHRRSIKLRHASFNTQQNNHSFLGGGINGSSLFLCKNVNMVTKVNVSEHCSVCNKKKRVDIDNIGDVRSDVSRQMISFGDSINFLGLRLGENKDCFFSQKKINSLGIQTYKPPLMPQSGLYEVLTKAKQGVEIVAVHKKGSAEDGNNSTVLMEYEFFPSLKVTNDHSYHQINDEIMTMKMTNETRSSEASCSYPAVDLSLKLSY